MSSESPYWEPGQSQLGQWPRRRRPSPSSSSGTLTRPVPSQSSSHSTRSRRGRRPESSRAPRRLLRVPTVQCPGWSLRVSSVDSGESHLNCDRDMTQCPDRIRRSTVGTLPPDSARDGGRWADGPDGGHHEVQTGHTSLCTRSAARPRDRGTAHRKRRRGASASRRFLGVPNGAGSHPVLSGRWRS